MSRETPDSISRRQFLRLVGIGLASSGLAAIVPPAEASADAVPLPSLPPVDGTPNPDTLENSSDLSHFFTDIHAIPGKEITPDLLGRIQKNEVAQAAEQEADTWEITHLTDNPGFNISGDVEFYQIRSYESPEKIYFVYVAKRVPFEEKERDGKVGLDNPSVYASQLDPQPTPIKVTVPDPNTDKLTEIIQYAAATKILEMGMMDTQDVLGLTDLSGAISEIQRTGRLFVVHTAYEVSGDRLVPDLLDPAYCTTSDPTVTTLDHETYIYPIPGYFNVLDKQRTSVIPDPQKMMPVIANFMQYAEAVFEIAGHDPNLSQNQHKIMQMVLRGFNALGQYNPFASEIITFPDGRQETTTTIRVQGLKKINVDTAVHENAHSADNRATNPESSDRSLFSQVREAIATIAQICGDYAIPGGIKAVDVYQMQALSLSRESSGFNNGYQIAAILIHMANKLGLTDTSFDFMKRYQQTRREMYELQDVTIDSTDPVQVLQWMSGKTGPYHTLPEMLKATMLQIAMQDVTQIIKNQQISPYTFLSALQDEYERMIGYLKVTTLGDTRLLNKVPADEVKDDSISTRQSWCWQAIDMTGLDGLVVETYDATSSEERVQGSEVLYRDGSVKAQFSSKTTAGNLTPYPGLELYIATSVTEKNPGGYIKIVIRDAQTNIGDLIKKAAVDLGVQTVMVGLFNDNIIQATGGDVADARKNPILVKFNTTRQEVPPTPTTTPSPTATLTPTPTQEIPTATPVATPSEIFLPLISR